MATKLQLSTYLLGICLFSICFLVFVNATISFVITEIVHQRGNVGDAAGTLGFADELLAVVACPIWGLLSDRFGYRLVVVIGYTILAASLFLLVQSANVYPQLLLTRLLFSLGASCVTTMVTAVLPSMVSKASSAAGQSRDAASNIEGFTRKNPNSGHARLAGFVGLFTGVGALGALGIFLPLPSRLQKVGLTPEKALADTYYIAGATAIVVAIACYVGLRGQLTALPLRDQDAARGNSIAQRASSTLSAITTVLKLGFTKPSLGLGFLASFVARSSSVGISLFIPLFVNASLCDHPAQDVEDVKAHCRKAYVIAAQLSGVSQLFALGFAPIFGYFPFSHNHFNLPLTVATLSGTVGYVLFARLNTSEISPGLLLIVALLGISQIGAIVTSLSLVSSFVMETVTPEDARSSDAGLVDDDGESTHLLHKPSTTETHEHLKGTIAGVYSFAGSLAILVLTKLGGVLFDRLGKEAPFYLLAIFNMGLFVAVVVCGGLNIYQTRRRTAV